MDFYVEEFFAPHPRCYRSVCESCGVGSREGVRVLNIPNIEIDHEDGLYGNLWLCECCVVEWARAFGAVTPADTAIHLATIVRQQEEINALHGKLEELKNVRAALEAVGVSVKDAQVQECPECGEFKEKRGLNLHRRSAHGVGKEPVSA